MVKYMIVESTVKPEPVEIRKLGVIDDTPVAYIYINTDVKETLRKDEYGEQPIYTYNMEQITTPLPDNVVKQVNLEKIQHHSHNQETEKQLARLELAGIKNQVKEAPQNKLRKIDRLDKASTLTSAEIDKVKADITKAEEEEEKLLAK